MEKIMPQVNAFIGVGRIFKQSFCQSWLLKVDVSSNECIEKVKKKGLFMKKIVSLIKLFYFRE